MGRFNLLDEPWIRVICDDEGKTQEVSLHDLFCNAHNYRELAGDMKTQDFAILRMLLAVVHTVFSRFDARGNSYDILELDEYYVPKEELDSFYSEDYAKELKLTWFNLWDNKQFPNIVNEYLEKWREHFFLFDEKYPFYQVTKNDIRSEVLNKPSASEISGKNINRLISESGNKVSLFSPKYETLESQNKEKLTPSEIARWLVMLQGYIGLSDKVIFGIDKYKASKGWLFDIGGIFLKGRNLFETLLINCFLPCKEGGNLEAIQRPCWEISGKERIDKCMKGYMCNNLSELYTDWSRAVYIDPDFDTNQAFACSIVKLPELAHKDNFLEPMTIWKYNSSGENKDSFTPKKHVKNQSLWRSFALVTQNELMSAGNHDFVKRRPGIIDWMGSVKDESERRKLGISNFIQGIYSVSMQDDGNATSWVPTDEIVDFLPLNDFALIEKTNGVWVAKIKDTIDKTKKIIEFNYKNYLKDINDIRGLSSDVFVNQEIEQIYFLVDKQFRRWLIGLNQSEDPDLQIEEWEKQVKKLVFIQAEELFKKGTNRDFKGIEAKDKDKEGVNNIALAFNRFTYFLNVRLDKGGNHATGKGQ